MNLLANFAALLEEKIAELVVLSQNRSDRQINDVSEALECFYAKDLELYFKLYFFNGLKEKINTHMFSQPVKNSDDFESVLNSIINSVMDSFSKTISDSMEDAISNGLTPKKIKKMFQSCNNDLTLLLKAVTYNAVTTEVLDSEVLSEDMSLNELPYSESIKKFFGELNTIRYNVFSHSIIKAIMNGEKIKNGDKAFNWIKENDSDAMVTIRTITEIIEQFKLEDFTIFPNYIEILDNLFQTADFNYKEKSEIVTLILSKCLRYLESLNEEDLKSLYADLINRDQTSGLTIPECFEEFKKVLEITIQNYRIFINENGTLVPKKITESDSDLLKSPIIRLNDDLIRNELFYCNKAYLKMQTADNTKYEKRGKQVRPDFDDIRTNDKKYKEALNKIKRYIDNEGIVISRLEIEEIEDLKALMLTLNYSSERQEKVLKQVFELNKEYEDLLLEDEIVRLKEDTLTESELAILDWAYLIIRQNDLQYKSIINSILEQIEQIQILFQQMINADLTNKLEYQELVHLSFAELSDIANNYYLIDVARKRTVNN